MPAFQVGFGLPITDSEAAACLNPCSSRTSCPLSSFNQSTPQSTPTGCPTTALEDAPVKPFKNKEEVPARSVTLLRYINHTPLILQEKLPALITSAPKSNSSPWFSRLAAFAYF